MISDVFSSEILKIRRLKLWIVIILGASISVTLAFNNFFNNYDIFMQPGDNPWIEAWTQIAIFMGPFILPILVGIFTVLIFRSEHIGGGWKQILALPISRTKVYISKFLLVAVLMGITQFVVLVLFLFFGFIKGIKADIPLMNLIIFSFRGWLASLPLISIQLIPSLHWDNFGVPLGINIIFTLPSLFVANSKLGQFYPWTQPLLAMSPMDETPITSMLVFYLMILLGFIIPMLLGIKYFKKKGF